MLRVLYVDDDPSLLSIGKLYLESTAGFEVDTLTSAVAALAAIPKNSYDAIVSDYQMPVMDGIAFLKAVRASDNPIPFILFTGKGREEIVIQALNEGADFYLQKGGEPRSQFAELSHKIRIAVERRQALGALKDSEQRLNDIINFLPDATFAIDRAGTVIAWNKAIEEMTGIPADRMLGKGDYEYAIPFYGERRPILIDLIFEPDEFIAKNYARIIHKKGILIAETPLPRPQRRAVTLMGKASPLRNRLGDVVGAIESIRDITELRHAEEDLRSKYAELAASQQSLRESEEMFRSLVRQSADGITLVGEDGSIIEWNKALETMTGIPREEAVGTIHTELMISLMPPENLTEERKTRFRESVADALRTGTSGYFSTVNEAPIVRRDGKIRVIQQIAFPIKTARGWRVGSIARDVTDWPAARDAADPLSPGVPQPGR